MILQGMRNTCIKKDQCEKTNKPKNQNFIERNSNELIFAVLNILFFTYFITVVCYESQPKDYNKKSIS